jgi:hypothetical protein
MLVHRNMAVVDLSSIQPHKYHKQQISELKMANHQLEVDLHKAIDHMEHKPNITMIQFGNWKTNMV